MWEVHCIFEACVFVRVEMVGYPALAPCGQTNTVTGTKGDWGGGELMKFPAVWETLLNNQLGLD